MGYLRDRRPTSVTLQSESTVNKTHKFERPDFGLYTALRIKPNSQN